MIRPEWIYPSATPGTTACLLFIPIEMGQLSSYSKGLYVNKGSHYSYVFENLIKE